MKANYTLPSKQHGIVMPLVAIAMLALIGVTGLALDMGHMYENKTRLQNAVDAAALSAAKTLDETKGDQTAATAAAENTVVDRNVTDAANSGANDEMSAIAKGDVLVDFFELAAGACGSAGYANCFVRVRVANLSRPNFLIQVLGLGNTKTVAARAVAGPSPILESVCDVVPMMVCAQDGDLDDATDDGKFYGYTPGTNYCLKRGPDPADCPPGAVLGNGNFQLINLDDSQGGSDICTNLSGAYSKCLKSGNIDLKPGGTVGPVEAGLNTRFNIYPQGQGQCEGVLDSTHAPPDAVVSYGTGAPGASYTSWKSAATEIANGVRGRRLVSVPVGNCPEPCNGASCVAPLLDFACFYLLEPVDSDPDKPKGMVVGEFTNEGCVSKGKPGTDPTTGPGPYVIQLYKDPLSGDS